jgi:dTDP-glucose 4,6-dehydratase
VSHPKRRLLVTGGAGFIGSNFVHYWIKTHSLDLVVVLDALTYAGNRTNLTMLEAMPNLDVVVGDIGNRALVAQLMRDRVIDTVVHFAAESHVDRSIVAPDAFIKTNIVGTHNLLEVARALWLGPESGRFAGHRFHHVSTDEVYGSLDKDLRPSTEESNLKPTSPYAASKAAADLLVRSYGHTYGLQVTLSNCSNNYGPFQFPEKLIALTIVSVLEGRRIPIYGDGMQVRDWLHVLDHCRGIERILDCANPGTSYNIGGWASQTNLRVVRLLCDSIDAAFACQPSLAQRFPAAPAAKGSASSSLICHVSDRPAHDRRYALDPGRITSELQFQPEFSLEEGLRQTIDWYLNSESWWRAILARPQYRDWIQTNYSTRARADAAADARLLAGKDPR